MTVPVSMQQRIRELAREGVSEREISRVVGVSRNTVAKYTAIVDYSPKPPVYAPRSKVDPYARVVTKWLKEDESMPRKQRPTAKRVWARLVEEEGFTGSYDSVARWIKRYRLEHRRGGEGYSELAWSPGFAQVDFGQALALIEGQREVVHALVLTFPFSNARYVVAYPGETAECVCHGLREIFEYVGVVPHSVVFDNATGVGHRKRDGTVAVTRVFEAFQTHYGFHTIFTNPQSGQEKGSVENAVGFLRRNLMVPIPAAQSLQGLSEVFLERCNRLLDRTHYRKRVPIRELFNTDKDACWSLPRVGFDACSWESRIVDNVGNIHLGQARYHMGSRYHGARVHVGIRALTIEVLDLHGDRIVEHERIYTHTPETVIDPATMVPSLIKRPRALRQSVIRPYLPQSLLAYLDQADNAEARRIWRAINNAGYDADFTTMTTIIADMITQGRAIDDASICLAVKTASEGPREPDIHVVDLSAYDQIMNKGA